VRGKLPRRTIVFGGRDFTDWRYLFDILDRHHAAEPFVCIIEGGARGADMYARRWARSRGIPCFTVPADWKQFGRSAGVRRNQRMIDEYAPTEGIGFPGGRGTADMMTRIRKAGLDWIQCEGPLHG
jgi:hypothetical protein